MSFQESFAQDIRDRELLVRKATAALEAAIQRGDKPRERLARLCLEAALVRLTGKTPRTLDR